MPVFSLLTKKQSVETSSIELYKDELQELNARMRAVHREFNSVSDESLVDGIIYELLSISNRQSFLLNAIKTLNGENTERVSTQSSVKA
jgi:hypothetical protein